MVHKLAAVTVVFASSAVSCHAVIADPPTGGMEKQSAIGDLSAMLEPIRDVTGLPALGGAVVNSEGLVAVAAVGLRKIGSDEPIRIDDPWQIGSCTKAMTATMIGRLVENGTLTWDTTVGDTFADEGGLFRPVYGSVTLTQLLAHRSGLPSDRTPDAIHRQLWSLTGPVEVQRAEAVKLSLSVAPATAPGAEMLYSNRGYLVAACVAERATGRSWEALMRDLVFAPLNMRSAGYGAPGTAGMLDQPRGHRHSQDGYNPIEPSLTADNPPVLRPGGGVHCSLSDWAKFIALHLRGARGESGLLKADTFKRLHTPVGGPDAGYALGWLVTTRPWARGDEPEDTGRVLMHAGTNGLWYTVVWLAPEKDLAFLAVTNCGGEKAAAACDQAIWAMIQRQAGLDLGSSANERIE
jgi:CubicO group peptidase (beta-lactamase class C family)